MLILKVACTLILFSVLALGREYRVPMFIEKNHRRSKGNFKTHRITIDNEYRRGPCQKSATVVRDAGPVCSEQTIFEENFDALRPDIWEIEQYIPIFSEEFPFASYQRSAVSIKNGYVHIMLMQQATQVGFSEASLYNGKLELSEGCTSDLNCCSMQASESRGTLPPIIAGQINSKGFAFTYGTVHIRAKLPQGDWIYPENGRRASGLPDELLLKPFLEDNNKYGVIKIASALGNKNLKLGNTSYSNWVLSGGPRVRVKCQDFFQNNKQLFGTFSWGADFHIYSVRWAPESLTLYVDNQIWALVLPQSVLSQHFLRESVNPEDKCGLSPDDTSESKSTMAPFNSHFYISLGIGVGGMTEFPDGIYSDDDHPKPWKNTSPRRKAMLDFWSARNSWLHTWNQPELVVDYVKVVAL